MKALRGRKVSTCAFPCGTRGIRLQRNRSNDPPHLLYVCLVGISVVGVEMLTSYAVVEEPPKEDSEYCKTHMILEDHLRPNCPIEEASVRWVPEPPVVVSAYILAGL